MGGRGFGLGFGRQRRTISSPPAFNPGAQTHWRLRILYTGGYNPAASNNVGLSKVEIRTSLGSIDIAPTATITASYFNPGGYSPSNVADGNNNTMWVADANRPAGGHWLQFVFPSPVLPYSTVLRSRPDGFSQWPHRFIWEYSVDAGSTWLPGLVPVEPWPTAWADGVDKTFTAFFGDEGGYRYHRIRAPTTNAGGAAIWFALSTLGFRNGAGNPDQSPLCLESLASAALGGYPQWNVHDGLDNTFWTTAGSSAPAGGPYVTLDFGIPRGIFNHLTLRNRGDGSNEGSPFSFEYETSSTNTGGSFTSRLSRGSEPAWTSGETRTYNI